MTKQEYDKAVQDRQKTIRENAGRRIKGLPQLPVPPKPTPPMGWELLDEHGDYAGFTKDTQEKDDFLIGHPKRKAKRVQAIN